MRKNFTAITQLYQQPPLNAKWLFIILALVFIPQIFISHSIAEESMMQDLHSRIIATRLMQQNHSPYFFQWYDGDDVKLLNPNIHLPYGLNGVTATPFILWLQQPLAGMNYCNIKFTWWLIEEALLFATLFLACLIPKSRSRQLITIVVSSLFFCYSRNWWQHVYSGQYYILFAFIFALASFVLERKPKAVLLLFPIAALLRPFFLLAVLPRLLKNWRANIKWLISGCFVVMLLVFASGMFHQMPEYSKAMKLYSAEVTGWNEQYSAPVSASQTALFEPCVYKVNAVQMFGAGCLFSVQHYLQLLGVRLKEPVIFTCMLTVFIALFLWLTGYKKITADCETMLLASFLIYIFCELFTPANRNPYNMIQYLGIIGLVVKRTTLTPFILFVAGLALNHDFPFRFAYQREIGEALLLLSIYFVLLKANRNTSKTSQAFAA